MSTPWLMPQSAGTSMLHQPPSIQERLLDNASQGPAVDLISSSAATIASSRGDHRFRRKRSAMHHWPWKHRAEMPNVRPCPITAARREGKLTVGEGALTWAGYEHPDDRSFQPIADFHHVLHRSYSHGYPQGLRDYSHPCWPAGDPPIVTRTAPRHRRLATTWSCAEEPFSVQPA